MPQQKAWRWEKVMAFISLLEYWGLTQELEVVEMQLDRVAISDAHNSYYSGHSTTFRALFVFFG